MVRTKRLTPSGIVSINDVARLSGVSITTVSRVINKFPSVKEGNRHRVLEAMKQLKYQPSSIAQQLASGKSSVVALVIPRYEGVFYSFYALELIRGVGTLCEVLKLDLLMHLTDAHTQLNFSGLGGVIFSDIIGNRSQVEEALRIGLPCIVVNNDPEGIPVNCIAIDNVGGAIEAVSYLISLGHKKVAHITGDLITQAAAQRLEGYKKGLKKNNIEFKEELVIKTDYSRGQARQAAELLLAMPEPPSAVFVASDSMALEVMAVAREMGKEIPKDLSIVGFDDNPSGLYGPVALTTVRQPLVKMAEESVKELYNIMNAKNKSELKPKKIILPTELVIRESCRPLKH